MKSAIRYTFNSCISRILRDWNRGLDLSWYFEKVIIRTNFFCIVNIGFTVKTAQAFLPRVSEWVHYRRFDFITHFSSKFFKWREENSNQDSIQYSNFDWINEKYAYTILGTLSTRTSPVVAGNLHQRWLTSKQVQLEEQKR